MPSATVTVGMPVYNCAPTVGRAVESALAQAQPGTLVHIADNASTDETPEICCQLATRHAAVTFTRHATNLGIFANFEFVLQQAETEYFMWLAGDDYIAPTYVEQAVAALELDPTLVACAARSVFVHPDGTERPVGGTYPLLGDTVTNLAAYLSWPSDNTRIFGVYRTNVLKSVFPPHYFHAYDWAIAAGTLLHGKHMEVPEILMARDETPASAYVAAVRRDSPTILGQLFPLVPMTVDLLRRQKVPLEWAVIKALLKINLEMHAFYALHTHPRYGRMVSPLLHRHLLWRLTTQPPVPLFPRPRNAETASGFPDVTETDNRPAP